MKRDLPEIVERELDLRSIRPSRAVAIIGPRRAGKTTYLFQRIKALRKDGKGGRVLYLNFEDDRLFDLRLKDLDRILGVFRELNPGSIDERLFLFFDEVQRVDEWESYIRRLLDTENAEVYISGSSSRLLSTEIATSMRGRSLSYIIMPFSFREFLAAKERASELPITSKEKAMIRSDLREYMMYGGFPEVVLEDDVPSKLQLLREYVDMMLMRDVVERHGVRNVQALRGMLVELASSVSTEFSVNRYHGQLSSIGIKVGKRTLYEYLDHLEEAFAIVPVRRFSRKLIKIHQSLPKVYPIDMGMMTQTEGRSSEDLGKYMEATVAIELTRRRNDDPLLEFYYWKEPHGKEVDFILKHGIHVTKLIQVCYDIGSPETRSREVKALLKASGELDCEDLLVLTWDHEGAEETDGRTIQFQPLWKWLLGLEP
ncbi:MAG: ATP-binding protein [Thermoplasmata archaeon]|nr:ATP-binding protein [Thermoplasmata archaeon]